MGETRAKETIPECVSPYIKALGILRGLISDPKAAGISDPNELIRGPAQGQKRTADTASSQAQSKTKQGKSVPDSYAAAVTGKTEDPPHPIGAKIAKTTSAKVPAKYASGAIGAKQSSKAATEALAATAKETSRQVGAKQPSKAATEVPPAKAKETSQPATVQQSTPEITEDSALQYSGTITGR